MIGKRIKRIFNKAIGERGGVCCFCAKPVDEAGLDPCTLSIVTNGEGSQSWPCHSTCYLARLGDLPYGRELFAADN